jgi:hypothetical protein
VYTNQPPPPPHHAPPAPDPVPASEPDSDTVPGALRIAAIASLGAGAIHATCVGSHGDERTVIISFALIAALQIGWGALALVRSGRLVSLSGLAVNGAALGGWVLSRTSGMSFIDGFETAESPGFPDTLAAALAAIAILGAVAALARRYEWVARPRPVLVALAGVAVLSVSVPGMVKTGDHDHAATDGHGAGDHDTAATGGHDAEGMDHGDPQHDMEGMDHEHGEVAQPVPFDGTLPVDLGGVPGVTPEEQAEAEDLVTRTIQELPQFADPATLPARGWYPIGDAVTGFEHYMNWPLIDDDEILDPSAPESIVYQVGPGGERTLVAAMFITPRDVTVEDPPDFGGPLVQWHAHDNLCYGGVPNQLRIMAVVPYPQPCPGTTFRDHLSPMIHVWIVPNECGPFASLEGDGGGVLAQGETRMCDHAHGSA